MKETKKITVIMPVYNSELYLDDILTDLIRQTYHNLEIIIIDDGSKDNSATIIEKYKKQDERIQLVQTKNGGPSRARNLGLEMATGEYIRFLDADDRIPEKSMETLMKAYAKDERIDLVVGNYTCNIPYAFFMGEQYEDGIVDENEFALRFSKEMKTFYFGVPWNKLYRRELIEKYQIRFEENVIWSEDYLFNLEYYKRCHFVYMLNCPGGIYEYYKRDTGITYSVKNLHKEEFRTIEKKRFQKGFEYCQNYGLEKRFELEWKYSHFYVKLCGATHGGNGKNIWERFHIFEKMLKEPGVDSYIKIKIEDGEQKIWKRIGKAVQKDKYLSLFLLFSIKEIMGRSFREKMPFLISKLHVAPKSM